MLKPWCGLWNSTLLWFKCLLLFQNHIDINIRKKVQLKTKRRELLRFLSPNHQTDSALFPGWEYALLVPLLKLWLTWFFLSLLLPPKCAHVTSASRITVPKGSDSGSPAASFLVEIGPSPALPDVSQDMTAQKKPWAETLAKSQPLIFPDLLWKTLGKISFLGQVAFSRKTLGKIPFLGQVGWILCCVPWSDR